ncbi:type IV pilus modification PilV family protein [Oceanobacter mangrovi]|uniref:type IV pilus modification PilV family protein n=1 Tax=Oceanobacter mangrovi TaxID=2862510 RepID=UPI001C8DC72A|nr:prepilin-type N-terminal cleavage/methylation domain-containing protein [Oceanobacter mangrovi]
MQLNRFRLRSGNRPAAAKPDQSGFSMVEVLVTIAISTIGLVGLAFAMLESDRYAQQNTHRSLAANMLEDLSNRIRLNAYALDAYDTSGSAYSCGSAPARCAAYNSGTAHVDADSCDAETLAAYDLWATACSSGSSDSDADYTFASSADFLPNPQLIVTITDAVGYDGSSSQVVLSLSWDVRNGGQDSSGNTVYTNTDDIETRTETISTEFSLWPED